MIRTANVLVILFMLNASSGLFVASGLAEDMGVDPEVGGDDELSIANKTAQNVTTGSGSGGTLFSMLAAAGKTVRTMMQIIFIGPIMFSNLGVPDFINFFVFAPMYIIVGFDVIQVLTGRLYT